MIITCSTVVSLSGFGLLAVGTIGGYVNAELFSSAPAYSELYIDPQYYEFLSTAGITLIGVGTLGLGYGLYIKDGWFTSVSGASAQNTPQTPVVPSTTGTTLPSQNSTDSFKSFCSENSDWLTPPIDSSRVQAVETIMSNASEQLMITQESVTSWTSFFDPIFSFFSS